MTKTLTESPFGKSQKYRESPTHSLRWRRRVKRHRHTATWSKTKKHKNEHGTVEHIFATNGGLVTKVKVMKVK